MQYITSIERFGREEGRKEGRVEGKSSLLNKQLVRRFGALPDWVLGKLEVATEQDIESWAEAILTAPSLEAVFENQATH